MKYAVLESGGKQYVAREGETIEVDRLPTKVGQSIDFKDVLLVVDKAKVKVGTPFIKGAKVRGTVVDQIKAPKVIVFKYIPKERYRRKRGHRQQYTRVAIDSIRLSTPRKKATAAEDREKSKAAKSTVRTSKKTSPSKAKTGKSTEKAKPAKSKSSAKPKTKSSGSK